MELLGFTGVTGLGASGFAWKTPPVPTLATILGGLPGAGTPSKNVFSHLYLVSVLQPTITSVPQRAASARSPRW